MPVPVRARHALQGEARQRRTPVAPVRFFPSQRTRCASTASAARAQISVAAIGVRDAVGREGSGGAKVRA